jgi:hypothetical protein
MTDIAIFGAFAWVVAPLQMKSNLKATVIALVGLRLV